MANILPKAREPEGQREYLSVKTRTTPPVSTAPKKRTFSPWCVPLNHLIVSPRLYKVEYQALHTLMISLLQTPPHLFLSLHPLT